jgi:hypothetical protein
MEDEAGAMSALGSMGQKRDTACRRDDVGWRRGGTGEEKRRRQHQLG